METKTDQNQIVITTDSENQRKMLPANVLLSLAAGAIAGVAIIFGLIWAIEKLSGI